MRRHAFDLIVLLTFATAVAVAFYVVEPGDRAVTVRVYVLLFGVLAMAALVLGAGDRVARGRRSAFDEALQPPPTGAQSITELERLVREVTLATATEYDLQLRLVPTLREIAWAAVERTGRVPGPETLGRWWPLLDPQRESPPDRRGNGISEADLRALVSDLARM